MSAVWMLVLALAAPWVWPVAGPHDVIRPFIAPASDYGPGHRGVDLAAPDGVVRAPADGVVRYAGVVVDRPVLTIDHGEGVVSSYEPLASALVAGDPVTRGQPIGAALSGHCSRLCVHLGVRVDGRYVSPMRFLGRIPRAVLLPTRWSALEAAAGVREGRQLRHEDAPAGRSP